MNFMKDCLKGIALGAGAILPGISSGVLCVIFGIYEKLLDAILNFFKDMKKDETISFLGPKVLEYGHISKGWKLPSFASELVSTMNYFNRFST